MKVKYIGDKYIGTAFETDKVYEVISIEKGWYRVMTDLDEDYLFPPECFEIIESQTDFGRFSEDVLPDDEVDSPDE